MSSKIKTLLILFSFACFVLHAQERNLSTPDSDQQFRLYLENMLEKDVADAQSLQDFQGYTWKYWIKHVQDYWQSPQKYKPLLSLYYRNLEKYKRNDSIKIDRYESAIENFRRFDTRNSLPQHPVLFVGSSSIVHWETAKFFPGFPVVNRGFGGASLSEIDHYYDDIIKKHAPSFVVIYCDIDIENGKSPDAVVGMYKGLVNRIIKDFPSARILLLSMKPALVDDFLGKDVRKNKEEANRMLEAYCSVEPFLHYIDITQTMLQSDGKVRADIFLADGIHLNQIGYELWSPVVRDALNSLIDR